MIEKSAKIGNNVKIGNNISIFSDVKIGDGVIIEDGARIYSSCKIGSNCVIGPNSVLRPNTVIGDNTVFGTCSVSEGKNKIGDNTTIHAQCHITSDVKIGNNCFIAPFFIASNTPSISSGPHGTKKKIRGKKLPTVIEDFVRIGICVSITPGKKIGHHSEISQNCLVTKDIPPHSIVRGGKDQVGKIIGKNS